MAQVSVNPWIGIRKWRQLKKSLKWLLWLLVILPLLLSWPAWQLYGEIRKAHSEDPLVWEEDVAALEASTRSQCAPRECVVFVGSSSIRFWDTLEYDMSPIPVIRHGFGGAKLNDVTHYAKRLVSAYRPLAVVVFAGTNDIDPSASKSPGELLASYQDFVKRVHAGQSDLPVDQARKLAPDMILGASSHSVEEAVDAQRQGASYVNIGPIFPTQTKAWTRDYLGMDGVCEIAPHLDIPFTVMGGIKQHHIPDLIRVGAHTIAVVTAVTAADDPESAARELLDEIRTGG